MVACTDARVTVPLRAVAAAARTTDHSPPALHKFEVGRRLGGGGMGVVYEARDVVLDRRVALKFTRPDAVPAEIAAARLVREAKALARLDHPNVVKLFELGTLGDGVFIAMELVEGGTLRDWMRGAHDWRAIVDMFLAVGRGLGAVHELGLVHRDINPSNIFLDHDGTPKLGDFGLVSTFGADEILDVPYADDAPLAYTITTTGRALGTPAYMAPEQLRAGSIDGRADQFAFCVSLHEALTGALPHERRDRRPVPRPLRAILARGLATEPAARFPAMRPLLAVLARARRGRLRHWLGERA